MAQHRARFFALFPLWKREVFRVKDFMPCSSDQVLRSFIRLLRASNMHCIGSLLEFWILKDASSEGVVESSVYKVCWPLPRRIHHWNTSKVSFPKSQILDSSKLLKSIDSSIRCVGRIGRRRIAFSAQEVLLLRPRRGSCRRFPEGRANQPTPWKITLLNRVPGRVWSAWCPCMWVLCSKESKHTKCNTI